MKATKLIINGEEQNLTGASYTAGSGINIDSNNEISNTLPGAIVSATAPSSPTEGMVWYDTTNDALKTYDGTNWNIVGDDAADINTKTFFLTGTTGADNIASAQDAIDWHSDGKDPLIMYNNRCYILSGIADNGIEGAFFTFESTWNNSSAVNGNQTVIIETAPGQSNPYVVASISTGVKENHNARTQTFYVRSGTGAGAIADATSVLRWYKRFNIYNYGLENIFNPIILSADSSGNGQYTYHLTGIDTGVLIFTSLILTDEAPQDYYVERITINYTNDTVTSLQRDSYWIGKYRAGSGITIDQNNQISNSLPFNPANAGTTDDVLTKTANGYEWSAPTEPTVVSDDSGVTYHITVSNSDPTSGTASNIITLVP